MKQVALLRGINLGNKNKLPMKDLIAMFTEAGCTEVTNYIQSGNVIFSAPSSISKTLPTLVTDRIAQRFGYRVPVILRTAKQIAETLRNNPFLEQGVPEKMLYVYFLAHVPSPAALKLLDPDRSPPDVFHARGQELYMHLPNGMGQTKYSNAYLDSKLSTVSTARNWNTVRKLGEMLGV